MSKAVIKKTMPKNRMSPKSSHPDAEVSARMVDRPPDFVDQLPMAVYACDVDGRVRWFNVRAAQMWGRSPRTGDGGELYCGSHRLFLKGREIAHAETPMAEVLRTGKPVHGAEVEIERPDGSRVWAMAHIEPVKDNDGNVAGAINYLHDITTQKANEDRLSEQDQRLAATYENAAMAISEVDAEGRLRRVNEAACAITGYARDELLGLSVFDLTHPDDRPQDLESFQSQSGREGAAYSVEKRLIRKSGEIVWVNVSSSSVRDADGHFLYGIRVMRDITEQRRAFEIRQRFALIVESSDDAIVSKDLNGVIVTWNKGAERLFGYSAEEAIGRPIVMLIPATLENEEPAILSRIVRGERIEHYDTIRRRKDGTLIEISLSVSPIKDARGAIVGASKIARDVTERKRAEARQKALLDELNHRVKNTLATVQSLAAQSIRGAGVSPRIRQSFEGRLFALSRVHDQLSQSQWEMADLSAILHDIFAPFRGDGDGRVRLEGGSVRLEPQAALMLSMVLHELATNAAKYGSLSAPSGALDVKWSVANGAAPPRLLITWQETGGPEVRPPARLGFGSRLLDRTVNHQLNGSAKLTFEPGGLHCRIEVPLAAQKSGVA
jgi:PAS domain S-box-containing protein